MYLKNLLLPIDIYGDYLEDKQKIKFSSYFAINIDNFNVYKIYTLFTSLLG